MTQRQEQLSLAYVRAIAATAGYTVSVPSVDDDSVDVTLSSRSTAGSQRRPRLDVQLKATTLDDRRKHDALHFPLKLKNYNDLRGDDNMVPRILVVMVHPRDVDHWLEQTEEQLLMRHTAYWVSLREAQESSNTSTVTVKLSRTQMLTPESLRALMERIGTGGHP